MRFVWLYNCSSSHDIFKSLYLRVDNSIYIPYHACYNVLTITYIRYVMGIKSVSPYRPKSISPLFDDFGTELKCILVG